MSTVISTQEEMKPPEPPGLRTWIRKNLFNSWFNGLLTIASLVLIYLVISGLVRWIFTQADWEPVLQFPFLYLIGQYPRDQMWRVGLLLAQLRTLFVDEGFGTQDEAGRQRLVEAINSVQGQFDLLLVITHIDELRDVFPVQIEVSKTPDGSRVRLR